MLFLAFVSDASKSKDLPIARAFESGTSLILSGMQTTAPFLRSSGTSSEVPDVLGKARERERESTVYEMVISAPYPIEATAGFTNRK